MAKTELKDLKNNLNIDKKHVNDSLLKYFSEINKPYEFTVNGTKIIVVFSTETNAPTIEDALASALCRKLG